MDLIDRLRQLAEHSQGAPVPEIDVRARVRATLRQAAVDVPVLLDRPSLAFAGLSLAIMALMISMSLPALSAVREPWAAYLSTPWSF